MSLASGLIKNTGLFSFVAKQSRSIYMAGTVLTRSPASTATATKFDQDEYDCTGAGEIIFSLPVSSAKCIKAGTFAAPPQTRHGLSGTPLVRDLSEVNITRAGVNFKHTKGAEALIVDVTSDLYGESFAPGYIHSPF